MSTLTRGIPDTMCVANLMPRPGDPEMPGRQFLQIVSAVALEYVRAIDPPLREAAAPMDEVSPHAADAVLEWML